MLIIFENHCKINYPSIFYISNGQQYLLDEFEKIDTSDFCLAHLFTYRDIPQGIQGLGYKKTMCRARWNKGFTTLLNHKVSYKCSDFSEITQFYFQMIVCKNNFDIGDVING